MKVLFVCYGGGHVEMVLPVLRALREQQPGVDARIFALTTAAGVARRAGEQPLGFVDFCSGERGAQALRHGEQLLGEQQHPEVARAESLAYLGLNFLEWVDEIGAAAAWERWRATGRQGFRPVQFFQGVLRALQPDVVVATNSPRSEQAAIEAAHALRIPTLSMVDLFALPADPYRARRLHADRIAVLAPATRDNLVEAGVPAERIVVTGNPAFDALTGPEAQAAGARFRAERGWGQRPVIFWAGGMEPDDAEPRWAGAALGRAVQQQLEAWTLDHEDACLAIRYHPNEWPQFVQPAAHPRIHWSQPDREGLLPVLAAADIVVVQATTVGAQAQAAGKQVLALGFSPIVQRTGMDYAKLGLGTPVARLEDLPGALEQAVARIDRSTGHTRSQGLAAARIAGEVAALAQGHST